MPFEFFRRINGAQNFMKKFVGGLRYLGDDSAAFNLRSGGAGHLIECGDFTRCPCLQCLFQASNKGAIVKGLFSGTRMLRLPARARIFSLSKAVMKIIGVKLLSAINCA